MTNGRLAHMSATDAFTSYMERDPLLRSTVVVVMMFDRAPDHERVVSRFDYASRIVPGLRHHLVAPPLRIAPPMWTVDPDFDLSWHVRRVAAAPPATLESLLDFARTEGMGDFDDARPKWTWTTIEGLEGGHAAGILKIHHSLTDGIGGIELAAQILDFEPDAPGPLDSAPAPDGRVLGGLGMLCDAIAFQRDRVLHGARDMVVQAPRRALRILREPHHAIADAWRTGGSIYRTVRPITDTHSPVMVDRRLGWHYAVLDIPTAELKRAGKSVGGSLNDAFLAGIAGGLERYHAWHGATPESLRVTMPISVRKPDDAAGGNHITLMRFEVSTAPCSAADRMRMVHERVEQSRHEPSIPFTNAIAEMLNLLPTSVVGSMLKHVDFLASNVPGLDTSLYLGGARMVRLYPFGPTIGAALNVTLLSYCDTCYIGVNCDTGAITDPDVLLEGLREGFAEVLATGLVDAG